MAAEPDLSEPVTAEPDPVEPVAPGPMAADPFRAEIDELVEVRESMARLQAREYRVLATLAARSDAALPANANAKEIEIARRTLAAELGVACRVSDRTMTVRLAAAETLVSKFPLTLAALGGGIIGAGHVRTITEYGLAITGDAARAEYERIVLAKAVAVTPGRLRRTAQLAAARLAEGSFAARHDKAVAEREVGVAELPDGMAEVVLTVPTLFAAAIFDRLTRQAQAAQAAGDPRSLGQLRADLACELFLTADPAAGACAAHPASLGIHAEVAILIPALSLLDQTDQPATLTGRGPIGLEEATALAAAAPTLTRILTDPVSEMVLAVDSYRPSAGLRTYLRLRDGRCRFPTCPRTPPAATSTTPSPPNRTETSAGNPECLCQGHQHRSNPTAAGASRNLSPASWNGPSTRRRPPRPPRQPHAVSPPGQTRQARQARQLGPLHGMIAAPCWPARCWPARCRGPGSAGGYGQPLPEFVHLAQGVLKSAVVVDHDVGDRHAFGVRRLGVQTVGRLLAPCPECRPSA